MTSHNRSPSPPEDGKHLPPLATLQREVHEALRDERQVDAVAAHLGLSPARLALYSRFVRAHVMGVLAKDFPLVRGTLPPSTWGSLCEAYWQAHPATSVEINQAAEGFPAFLEAALGGGGGGGDEDHGSDGTDAVPYPGLGPFHAALAAFEWAEFTTYTHPGRVPAHGEVPVATLNPTLAAVRLAVPVLEYVVQSLSGDLTPPSPLPSPDDGPEVVLFFRPPPAPGRAGATDSEADRVAFYRATDDLLFALKVTHDGLDAAAAAQAVGLNAVAAARAVAHAASLGLVVTPKK